MKNKVSILGAVGVLLLLWACIDYDFDSLPSVPGKSVTADSVVVDTVVLDTTVLDTLTTK